MRQDVGNTEENSNINSEDEELLREVALDPLAMRMKQYIQHGHVTTYDHCLSVARMSIRIAEGMHVRVDRKELIWGAFLHDYYLYDWHVHGDHLHGYHHPEIAARNAGEDFRINEKEQSIIRSHMWPLTLFHAPSSREAFIVCLADKICSTKETIEGRIR